MHDGHGPGVEFEEFLRASSLPTLQDEVILIADLIHAVLIHVDR